MKNRKQKPLPPKKITITQDETANSRSHLKHPSAHTKMSTNYTVHSTSLNPSHLIQASTEKKQKGKKTSKVSQKEQIADIGCSLISPSNSKSLRKPNLAIPLRQEYPSNSQQQQSCREYCLVNGDFVPITDHKQQKMLDEMFSKTATSSCQFAGFSQGYCAKEEKKLRKRALSSERRSEKSAKKIESVESSRIEQPLSKHEIGVQTTQRQSYLACAETEAVMDCCEIGIQYSERKAFVEENIEQQIPICLQTAVSSQIQQKTSQNQSLSDLLFKLQFTHLGDQQSFAFLSSNEKEHFTQLLQTVLSKLSPQPAYKPTLKPISFQDIEDSPVLPQDHSEGAQQSPRRKEGSPREKGDFQKLQQQIQWRECKQLNLIEDHTKYEDEDVRVNTSMMSVLNFLSHLFCYIEVNYADEFVYMIRKMYGHTFRQKYRRVTRGIPFSQDYKFKVVEESIFEDFVNQSVNSQEGEDHQSASSCNFNEILHLKAVFDAFNEHLEEYRPYFLGNGEQFPWAFKMFITMSEYSIDEDSLQIIFRQARDKIVEWTSLLCGMMPEQTFNCPQIWPQKASACHFEPLGKQPNPLQLKRLQRENRLIISWISQQNFEKDGVELFGTQALHLVSEALFQELVSELLSEASFFFN